MDNRKRDLGLLPDEILLHILSFLNAKQAVQSTLLSKRWVNLWTFLPNLNFDRSDFKNSPSFDNFVDKVLTLRNESVLIRNLEIHRIDTAKSQFFERIVGHTDVEHLSITMARLEGHYDFFLSSNTLLTLKIWIPDFVFYFPTKNFKKLVTLHIAHARFFHFDTFSACPNLENLTLINCEMYFCDSLLISGTRLSKLTISSRGRDFQCRRLLLRSSRLTFLKIEGLFPLSVKSLTSGCCPQINEIYFDFDHIGHEACSNEFKNMLHFYLTKLLSAFQNAEYVTLSTTTIEMLAHYFDTVAQEQYPSYNLKSLTLVPSHYRWHKNFKFPLRVMDYFLQNSPQADVNVDFQRKVHRRDI